jgi:hypothetical protein
MLYRLVAKIGLDRSGIHAVVGQLEAAGVPQHVRVYLHIEAHSLTSSLDHRLGLSSRCTRSHLPAVANLHLLAIKTDHSHQILWISRGCQRDPNKSG